MAAGHTLHCVSLLGKGADLETAENPRRKARQQAVFRPSFGMAVSLPLSKACVSIQPFLFGRRTARLFRTDLQTVIDALVYTLFAVPVIYLVPYLISLILVGRSFSAYRTIVCRYL
ncbi:hypothetical protein LZ30DRAFT_378346 [Colletotrichum cereale]|nr:hypothetical protein LZ30DRAFT_378346 [Colletotrichum cereale]